MDKYVDISGNAAYLRRRAAFDALFVPACRASADIRKPYRYLAANSVMCGKCKKR